MNAKKIFILIIVLAAAALLGYSLYATLQSDTSLGIVSCPTDENCIWTAHIHAYMPISICGEDYRLPVEVAPLSGPHTHEEKNIAHWHDKLAYDRERQAILETDPLSVGAFFEAIEVPFASNRIADKQNGDLCPDGKPGMLYTFINGELSATPETYLWRDHDVIQIFFDTRPLETIQAEVNISDIQFPKLGRG